MSTGTDILAIVNGADDCWMLGIGVYKDTLQVERRKVDKENIEFAICFSASQNIDFYVAEMNLDKHGYIGFG